MEKFKPDQKPNPELNRQRETAPVEGQKPLNVIETLANGFDAVIQRPWILLIPLALDLFLWLGPQISVKPIFELTLPQLVAALPPDAAPDTQANLEMLKQVWQVAGETINLWGLLTAGIPSVVGMQSLAQDPTRSVALVVNNGFTLLLWMFLLALGAIIITAIYFEATARAVRREARAPFFAPRVLRAGFDLTVFAILVLVGMFTLVLPLALGATVISLFSQGLGSFVVFGATLLMMWILLYLAFAMPAIFVRRVNAAQAILDSISVFRFDFWSAMGLIFLIYVIRAGFTFIWQLFEGNAWGIVFNVIANAFLGSGLIAATMVFYQDRMNWMAIARERLRQQQTRVKG